MSYLAVFGGGRPYFQQGFCYNFQAEVDNDVSTSVAVDHVGWMFV